MKKPQLYLALSASFVLLQANLLPVNSEPASIWTKLAGVSDTTPASKVSSKKQASSHISNVRSSRTQVAYKVAGIHNNRQTMLFIKDKDSSEAGDPLPAAALTIHEPLNISQATSSKESPALVAMNEAPSANASTDVAENIADKKLVAQAQPYQIIAQADDSTSTQVSPIPAAVTGTVDLEEFKPNNVIDLKVSQSRTFRLKNKIIRTSISDPSIAEPVVVTENQLVLLGKTAGNATLVIWDDAGNSAAVDVKVSRDYSRLQALMRQVDPRIIVQPFAVSAGDRIILRGDVDHPEAVIRAFSIANAFMDDRGMKILAAEGRLVEPRIGEQSITGGQGGSGATGGNAQLSTIGAADKYLYFSNNNNNVGRAEVITSEGGRVTSLIRVRKTPLIVLHVTFMEVNTAAVRELGVQLGLDFVNQSFSFGVGGQAASGTSTSPGFYLTSQPGLNGTQGSVNSWPGLGNAGSLVPIFSPLANGTAVPTTVANMLLAPQKTNTFGATTQPVNFLAANTIPSVVAGQLINTPISQVGQGVLNGPASTLLGQSVLLGAPGGASFGGANGLPNIYTATSNFNSGNASRWSVNPTVQGLITQSRARVLAEPTLVTLSGERAAFLAGGEIPIPQQIATAGAPLSSVSFEPFGLRLNMIPVLLENGTINLEVAPEERLTSQEGSFQLPGTLSPVPGFTTRKTQVIVELKPGQELFISGLISANSGSEVDKTPIMGEIPIIGALYRSKAFSKNESELVVAVRPEVIVPGNPGQLKLPENISKVESPRDMNMLQVEPTVIDERYMTSGSAERSQKIPGILPAGSPIPDNQ